MRPYSTSSAYDIMGNSTLHKLLKTDSDFRKTQKLTIFWIGFVLYTIGYTLSRMPSPIFLICDLLRLVGIGLFVPMAFLLISPRFESKYLKVSFLLYSLWLLSVVARGFDLNYLFIKNSLFSPFGGIFLYFTPYVLLLSKPPLFYKNVFKVISVLGLFYVFQIVLSLGSLLDSENIAARDNFEILVKTLALPSGFLLLTYRYHSLKVKVIASFVVFLSFLLATYMARRGLMFMTGSIPLLTFLVFVYLNKQRLSTLIVSLSTGLLLVGFGYFMLLSNNLPFLDKAKERFSEDTRSEVELYYYQDMETLDWLIGRGMSGMVAAPIGIEDNDDSSGLRDGIETDYLNIILKGGLMSFLLVLFIAVPAMLYALFKSRNSLSKAAGFWILLWLISLYPSTVTTFTMNFILVWIAIGIGYSKTIRSLNEETLRQYFRGITVINNKRSNG